MIKHRGVLFGLAAGDKNGGPVRMSVRLAECIIDQGGAFDEDRVFQVYYNWFRGPPHDTERAFDTGATFHGVMTRYRARRGTSNSSEMMSRDRDAAAQEGHASAGINAAHRNGILAALLLQQQQQQEDGDGDGDFLVSVAKRECRLTHVNPISQECAALSCCIVSELLAGHSFPQALLNARARVRPTLLEVKRALQHPEQVMSAGGFAPEVLAAAIHFCSSAAAEGNQPQEEKRNPREILEASLRYAGSANYCPVLVGTWLGAAGWQVPSDMLSHIPQELVARITHCQNSL